MEIVNTIKKLQEKILEAKAQGKVVGFIPTMGALHKGHLSLVGCSNTQTDFTVVSIFVNPTQFNNLSDLEKYPRTLEADMDLLKTYSVDVVFVPEVGEMYPEPDTRVFKFGTIETVMEGACRPGHFNGVAQVVSKLFDAVMPDKAFFGEKDFQQLAIIKAMVHDYKYPVQIVPCPIIREPDGLAMSSRNSRLTPDNRRNAVRISEVLFESKKWSQQYDVETVKLKVVDALKKVKDFEIEYFDVVDAISLQSVDCWGSDGGAVGCVAVFAGEIRLIDNIIY